MMGKVYKNPTPTTDTIIEYTQCGRKGIVLIERKNPPYGIAIPGGFAEFGISLEDNAIKEAKEETGLEVILESPERPLCVLSNPERDPRNKQYDVHLITVAYVGKGHGILQAGDDASGARLYSLPEIEQLIRDKRQLASLGLEQIAKLPDSIIRKNLAVQLDHDRILERYLQHVGYLRGCMK